VSTISLRLPVSLHPSLRNLAKEGSISIHQFIASALAERDGKGSKKKIKAALSKVKKVEPESSGKL